MNVPNLIQADYQAFIGYMKKFAEAYPDLSILQEPPAKLTWYHNTTLLDKVKDPETRLWHIEQTLAHGCSKNVLVHQIESNLHHRQVLADKTHNFGPTLKDTQKLLEKKPKPRKSKQGEG